MTNTDKKTKQFNREQIQHCLAIIDQLKPSGPSTLEFAKTQNPKPKAPATAKSEPGSRKHRAGV